MRENESLCGYIYIQLGSHQNTSIELKIIMHDPMFWYLCMQERENEVRQLQEKHLKKLSELRQVRDEEMQLLRDRLMERMEANSALSCQLVETKSQAEMRESELKTHMGKEISRMERSFCEEKVSLPLNHLT